MDAVGDHDLMHPTKIDEVSPQQSADRREETFPMVGMLHLELHKDVGHHGLHPDPDPSTVTECNRLTSEPSDLVDPEGHG